MWWIFWLVWSFFSWLLLFKYFLFFKRLNFSSLCPSILSSFTTVIMLCNDVWNSRKSYSYFFTLKSYEQLYSFRRLHWLRLFKLLFILHLNFLINVVFNTLSLLLKPSTRTCATVSLSYFCLCVNIVISISFKARRFIIKLSSSLMIAFTQHLISFCYHCIRWVTCLVFPFINRCIRRLLRHSNLSDRTELVSRNIKVLLW